MILRYLYITSAIFYSLGVSAQIKGGVFGQMVMPGPEGVYIFIPDHRDSSQSDKSGNTFIVSKDVRSNGQFKTLDTVAFPNSAHELSARLGPDLVAEILQNSNLQSTDDLYHQLTTDHLDTLGLFLMDKKVMIALGMLYLDPTRTRSDRIGYRVEVIRNGVKRQLYQKYLKEVVYTAFPKFKTYSTITSDSTISCTWYAVDGAGVWADIFRSGVEPQRISRQFIYQSRDTLFVSYTGGVQPGEHVTLFATPKDLADNVGHPSDTIRLIAHSMTDAVSLQNVEVKDTLGGMWLTWDLLPPKPWYTGIRISKSHSALGEYFVIDTLPADAVSWMDQEVLGGTVYYYTVEPLIYNLPSRPNTAPVLVSGTKNFTSGEMIAPQGLKITLDTNRNIRLSWMVDAIPNLFAYYVFRGTSPEDLQVISPPVFDTVYVDSLIHLNPGSQYLYALAARDMNMQWSDTTEALSILNPVNEIVTAPAGLSARFTEYGVRLFWNDVSLIDEKVMGYILYRRKKGEEYFSPITNQPWKGHTYTDTLIIDPGSYEYGCASMDARGNQSYLSPIATVYVPGNSYLYPPPGFTLKNSTEGVVIQVPAALNPQAGQVYSIYKKDISQEEFEKIASVPILQPQFVDRQVKEGTLYVYAVTLTQGEMESGMSMEKAIRRDE